MIIGGFAIILRQIRSLRRYRTIVTGDDLLDLFLRRLQGRLAMGFKRGAALIKGDRFLKRRVAAFKLLHDRFELGERLLKRQLRQVGSLFAHTAYMPRAPHECKMWIAGR